MKKLITGILIFCFCLLGQASAGFPIGPQIPSLLLERVIQDNHSNSLQTYCYNLFFSSFPKLKGNDHYESTLKYSCRNINSLGALSCAKKSFSKFTWIDWRDILEACGTIDKISTYNYCAKAIFDRYSEEEHTDSRQAFFAMKKVIYDVKECGRQD